MPAFARFLVFCVIAGAGGSLPPAYAQLEPASQAPLKLALSLAGQGRFPEAEEQAKKAVALAPKSADAVTALAMIRTRMGRSAEAIEGFRQVIALSPRSAEAHINLGIAMADALDTSHALDEFTRAARLAPRNASAHFNRGRALTDLKRYEEARAEFQTAGKLDPRSAPVLYRLALVEKQLGHRERSVELARKAVEIDPGNADAHKLLGQNLTQLEQGSGAIAQWKKAAELNPEDTEALYNLVRALRESDPQESKLYQRQLEAVQRQRQVIDRVENLSNFAIASDTAGDSQKAVSQLKEALAICGECRALAVLHKNLGLIYLRSGNYADGERELRSSYALDDKDVQVRVALERLDGMKRRRP